MQKITIYLIKNVFEKSQFFLQFYKFFFQSFGFSYKREPQKLVQKSQSSKINFKFKKLWIIKNR